MRLRARFSPVEPEVMNAPEECPYEDCQGQYFKEHQKGCDKPLRDTKYEQVQANRRTRLSCGRTHRVYPQGVSQRQQSERLVGLSILLYVLGLSY